MVVGDLDVLGAGSGPAEAHSKLVVHSDAVLPYAIALERFEAITRWHPQVRQAVCDLQLPKLAPGDRLNTFEPLDSFAVRKSLGFGTLERQDHFAIVTWRVITVNDLTSPVQSIGKRHHARFVQRS